MSCTRTNPSRALKPPVSQQPTPYSRDTRQPANSTPPRELQHRGAYSVKAPNPSKREKMTKVAEAETAAYERYKQQQRQDRRYVTTNASVGSPSGYQAAPSASNPPRRVSSLVSPSRNPKQKAPSLRSQTVHMEDPEVERRKAVQRQKAETLQAQQKVRQRQLDQDRRNKNSGFLDRLEGKR